MKKLTVLFAAGLIALSGAVSAKVPTAEADKLKSELMPLGGEKAGNGSSIPDWDGGVHKPDHKSGERYTNPWPGDKPKFTVTKSNMGEYKEMLSPGQLAMFEKYDSYKIPVYETRRSTSAPEFVYKATYENALKAELANDGEALKNAVTGIPFPIPGKNGKEIIWNHKCRYRGESVTRYNNQLAVTSSGTFTVFKLKEDVKFKYNIKGQKPEDLNNILVYFLQQTLEPARQAGGLLLVHDTLDQVKEARRAWLYNPGQRRLRRAPNVAYDNPGTGSDGLRVNDQLDAFNGALDRYTWEIVGKKEMIIPYNSYELHSDKYGYDDVTDTNHLNQDLARYEVHRVWVVDAKVKEGTSHIYKRRVFYVDEDTWSIGLVDIYDARDQLWRFQEAHFANAYDLQASLPVAGTVYDILANRYLVMDLNNEDPETVPKDFDDDYFSTSNVKKLAR